MLAWALDAALRPGYGRGMDRQSHDWERKTEEEAISRRGTALAPAQAAPAPSLAWASAIGNQAVQRLARRSVAREAIEEEEELEESAPEPEAVEDAAPAAEEDAAPAAEEAPPEGFAPEEAAGLEALDELPEDELPA